MSIGKQGTRPLPFCNGQPAHGAWHEPTEMGPTGATNVVGNDANGDFASIAELWCETCGTSIWGESAILPAHESPAPVPSWRHRGWRGWDGQP